MLFRSPWLCSLAFSLLVLVMLLLPAKWPRWAYMWLLAVAIYFGCKIVTWCAACTVRVSAWRQLAYLLGWPGMDADRFFGTDRLHRAEYPTLGEWCSGALNLIVGAILFWNAEHLIAPSSPILLGWAGMIGTILMLHFGSFHLLSCFWRIVGIDAPPLMNRPTRSSSAAEFWGRRWNTAFRDLTHQFLFRPLVRRMSPVAALAVSFVISGIIHDLVISVPAGGGYGGPTGFFSIQAAAVLFERSLLGKSLGLGRGLQGWLFTALVLLLPVRLLFHDPFVLRIAVPLMAALGAA